MTQNKKEEDSFLSNVHIKRDHDEIVSRKTFYYTNFVVAFCIGFVTCIIALICQFAIDKETGAIIAFSIGSICILLSIGLNIWYLFPLFRSNEKLWIKIFRPIGGLLIFSMGILAGYFVFFIAIFIAVLWFALLFVGNSSSSSSSSHSSSHNNCDVELQDGTKLKQTDFSGHEFKGDDGHTYTQEYGSYYRNDE